MNYSKKCYDDLISIIQELYTNKEKYVRSPDKDFTRVKKLSFQDLFLFLISMEGQSISKELYKYFKTPETVPRKSALIQRRNQISVKAFEDLFYLFNSRCTSPSLFQGMRLLACDGSDVNIPYNSSDTETLFQIPRRKAYNQLHINALYDLMNQTYVDTVIQPITAKKEGSAFREFTLRHRSAWDVILVADRGYESYQNFIYAADHQFYYLIRAKVPQKNTLVGSFLKQLPPDPEFDREVSVTLTSGRMKEVSAHPDQYRYVRKNRWPEYMKDKKCFHYDLTMRIVKVKISEKTTEYLLTNLPRDLFPARALKEIYQMRWGIETSFRELKYTIGLVNFHSRKYDFQKQEIWARMILYNFCMTVAKQAFIAKKTKKYKYQVNFSNVVFFCREFFRDIKKGVLIELDRLINEELLPIRAGRSSPRKLRRQSAVSFNYRVG